MQLESGARAGEASLGSPCWPQTAAEHVQAEGSGPLRAVPPATEAYESAGARALCAVEWLCPVTVAVGRGTP